MSVIERRRTKMERYSDVRELITEVKRRDKKGKTAHITLPFIMRRKKLRITVLDPIDKLPTQFEDWARDYGNSSHIIVNKGFIGTRVRVEVVD